MPDDAGNDFRVMSDQCLWSESHPDIDKAKAAANAHWRSRMASALRPWKVES